MPRSPIVLRELHLLSKRSSPCISAAASRQRLRQTRSHLRRGASLLVTCTPASPTPWTREGRRGHSDERVYEPFHSLHAVCDRCRHRSVCGFLSTRKGEEPSDTRGHRPCCASNRRHQGASIRRAIGETEEMGLQAALLLRIG